MRVTAHAIRSGNWWAIEVPAIPGLHTQVKRLDQVEFMVKDAAQMLGYDDVTIVAVKKSLEPAQRAKVKNVLLARKNLQRAKHKSSLASKEAVTALRNDGLSVRDIADLIGLTPQRISQLAR